MFPISRDRGHKIPDEKPAPRRGVAVIARGITAGISVIGLSLFAAAIPRWDRTFVHHKGPTKGAWQDGLPIAPLLLSFLGNAVLCISATRYPTIRFPVPVTIALDFIVWALLIPSITFATWGGTFRLWRDSPAPDYANGAIFCIGMNAFSRECFPDLYAIGSLELAGVTFACIVWLSHASFLVSTGVKKCLLRRSSARHRQHDDLHPINGSGRV